MEETTFIYPINELNARLLAFTDNYDKLRYLLLNDYDNNMFLTDQSLGEYDRLEESTTYYDIWEQNIFLLMTNSFIFFYILLYSFI